MRVAIVRTRIERATGRQVSQEIIGYDDVDEDAYYRPLVEIFGKRILDVLERDKQKCGLVESGDMRA